MSLKTTPKPISRSSDDVARLEAMAKGPLADRVGVWHGDITTTNYFDAIVNSANKFLIPGGGLSGAIHRAAGPRLAELCADLVEELPGKVGRHGRAYTTTGGRLHPTNIIHAVPVRWGEGEHRWGDDGYIDLTAGAYQSIIEEARRLKFRVIGIPILGSGLYGWPMDKAVETAVYTVLSELMEKHEEFPNRVVFFTDDKKKADFIKGWIADESSGKEMPFIC